MHDETEDLRQVSYWPSISDLFMTLFVIALVLVASVYLMLPTSPDNYKKIIETVGGPQLNEIREPTNQMREAMHLPLIGRTAAADEVVTKLGETAKAAVPLLRQSTLPTDTKTLRWQLDDALKRLSDLKKELDRSKEQNAIFATTIANLTDKPPIIKIADSGKDGIHYHFENGEALVSAQFQAALRAFGFAQLKVEILKRNKGGVVTVDTLEIIGHTDGVKFTHDGNLDSFLPILLAEGSGAMVSVGHRQTKPIFEVLVAGSNNDLGLLRALAIKKEWRDFVALQPEYEKAQLAKIGVRCYSAGQTIPEGIDPSEVQAQRPEVFERKNDPSRRIEIRLTKLTDR